MLLFLWPGFSLSMLVNDWVLLRFCWIFCRDWVLKAVTFCLPGFDEYEVVPGWTLSSNLEKLKTDSEGGRLTTNVEKPFGDPRVAPNLDLSAAAAAMTLPLFLLYTCSKSSFLREIEGLQAVLLALSLKTAVLWLSLIFLT